MRDELKNHLKDFKNIYYGLKEFLSDQDNTLIKLNLGRRFAVCEKVFLKMEHKIDQSLDQAADKTFLLEGFYYIKSQVFSIIEKVYTSGNVNVLIRNSCRPYTNDVATIYQHLLKLLSTIKPVENNVISYDISGFDALYADQEKLGQNEHFNNLLSRVEDRSLDIDNFLTPPTVYFCYADPVKPFKQYEKNLHNFLARLKIHLQKAGILCVKYNPVFTYQASQEINEIDYVVIFGTHSFLQCHNQGKAAIANQLIEIIHKRKKDADQKLDHVLPVILYGKHKTSLPSYYKLYCKTVKWYKNTYLTNLRDLIFQLYDIGQHDTIRKIWQDESTKLVNVLTEQTSVVDGNNNNGHYTNNESNNTTSSNFKRINYN